MAPEHLKKIFIYQIFILELLHNNEISENFNFYFFYNCPLKYLNYSYDYQLKIVT